MPDRSVAPSPCLRKRQVPNPPQSGYCRGVSRQRPRVAPQRSISSLIALSQFESANDNDRPLIRARKNLVSDQHAGEIVRLARRAKVAHENSRTGAKQVMEETAALARPGYPLLKGCPILGSLGHGSTEDAVLAENGEKLARDEGRELGDRPIADRHVFAVRAWVADRRDLIALTGESAQHLNFLPTHDVGRAVAVHAGQSGANKSLSPLAPGHFAQTLRDLLRGRRARHVGDFQPPLAASNHAAHQNRLRLEIEPIRYHELERVGERSIRDGQNAPGRRAGRQQNSAIVDLIRPEPRSSPVNCDHFASHRGFDLQR